MIIRRKLLSLCALTFAISIWIWLLYDRVQSGLDLILFKNWSIAEWLINYQDGFVRRGFAGQIFVELSNGGSLLPPLYVFLFLLFLSNVILFFWLFYLTGRRQYGLMLLILFLQGGLVHMGISGEFHSRKEFLFETHFLVLACCYAGIQTLSSDLKRRIRLLFVIMAVFGGGVLELVHEAYIFMCFPITLFLFCLVVHEAPVCERVCLRRCLLLYVFMVLGLFIVSSENHGSYEIAQSIWDSIPLTDRVLLTPISPYTVSRAAGALGWTMEQHLLTLYFNYVTCQWPYIAFFSLANLSALGYLMFKLRGLTLSDSGLTRYRPYFLLALSGPALSGFMFYLGSDWGRWISLFTNLTVIYLLAIQVSPTAGKMPNRQLPPVAWRERSLIERLFLASMLAYGLLFHMPETTVFMPEQIILPVSIHDALTEH